MCSCNYSRLLIFFSLLIACHATTLARRRSSSGDRRHLERQFMPPKVGLDFDTNEDFQPTSLVFSKIKTIVQAMDPPPNCTSLDPERALFSETPEAQHHNRLECFLWNLKVEIPEQSFKKGWVTITVHGMMCTNFRLHGLTSNSSVPPLVSWDEHSNEPNDLSALNISVQRVSATCQGSYHSTGGLAGNVLATVAQSSPSSKALELLVGVRGKQSADEHHNSSATVKLPYSFETKECGTLLGCEGIRFSGSISAKMIQAFSGRIGRYITQTLQEQVCPLMTKIADPVLTAYLKEFDDLVQPYLGKAMAAIDITNNDHFYRSDERDAKTKNIVEYSAIYSILTLLNEQLRYHLQTGWIPLPPPSYHKGNYRKMTQECIDSFRGISGWIISILGRRPRIPLPENLRHIVFPIPDEVGANGTVTLDIPEMVVEGLDEMDALQVLEPSKSKTLKTKIVTSKGFSVVLPIKLELQWPAVRGQDTNVSERPTLVESFQLTVNITQIDASLSSMIQVVNWESTSLLQVVDAVQKYVESHNIRDLACLFRTLQTVQLSKDGSFIFHNVLLDAIRLSRDKTEVPDGSLEADFDHTINTILELFLKDYADLWTDLVRGLVRGPGSQRLNQYVEGWIQKHSKIDGDSHNDGSCPSATRSRGQWVNFTKFEILNTFNRYLDHSHTKKSLNDFLFCLAESIEDAVDGDDDITRYHIADPDEFIYSSEYSEGISSFLLDDKIATSFLALSVSLSDIFKDNMNVFVDSGKTLSIRNLNSETKVTLSALELRNWDSIQRLQIMRPSGDTSLASSFVFGKKASLEEIEYGDTAMSWKVTNSMDQYLSSSIEPPEVALVVDIEGNKISGQVNLTLFGSLDASSDVNVDYDLNRLENLTISRLLDEINCALVPAMQIRFLPGSTNVAFGEYFGANLTAAIDGRNFSLSTNDFPQFLEMSNDALSWSQEFTRTGLNLVIEKVIKSSCNKCPGVVEPEDGHQDKKGHGEKQIYWMWRDSTTLWIILGLVVLMQGGLLFVQPFQNEDGDIHESLQTSEGAEAEAASRTTPLLSSYQELMSHPSSETFEQYQDIKPNNSIDDHIIRDLCEDWNEEDEPQGILEDQLVDEFQVPNNSLFGSDEIPEVIKYLIPIMIVGTIALFLSSNLSIGASVDLSLAVGQRSIGIPGLFQFSLSNTVSEMYMARIYPLLILVLCFSGIWPYVKLLLMLYFWMIPSADQHKQERRLLTLDAMGKYSLVDNYVLILFVVAFRFHLEISDSLDIDVYVTPVYGFFSFLFATCLSLGLGHAVLFFHRKTMQHHDDKSGSPAKSLILKHSFRVQYESSHQRRLSRIGQGLVVLFLIATFGFLILGFFQESFTFEIGGLAGIVLGEDARKTSYSVLSLGSALPTSAEDPQSKSIVLLQATFFFFTVVTPILCLIFILILMLMPLTLKWQRYLLVAAEIANSWSAVEVFLLSILAALFQISTFASFMIGDKCDELNILTEKIFDQEGIVCFTVDASVESNCWYLLVGATANIFLVAFLLGFAETAVAEKQVQEDSYCRALETSSSSTTSRSEMFPDTKRSDQTQIQKLLRIPFFRYILFVPVPSSPSPALEEDSTPLDAA